MIRKFIYSGAVILTTSTQANAMDMCRDVFYIAGDAMIYRTSGIEVREALENAEEHDSPALLKQYIFQAYHYPAPYSIEGAKLQIIEFAESSELHCLQHPEMYQ